MEILAILVDVLETSDNVVVLLGAGEPGILSTVLRELGDVAHYKPFAQAAPLSTMAALITAHFNYNGLGRDRAGSPCMVAN